MKTLIGLGIVVIIVLILGGWVMGTYNGLITKDTQVDTAWSAVETQYQRRFDLIPNLVGATKGALQQEQDVFGAIADARTRYAGTDPGTDERVQATNQVESALSRLLVIMENYPVLQSNATIRSLMDELAGTENRVTVARDRYNEQVAEYNVYVKGFPRNILAGMFGYEARTFFEAQAGSEVAPTVDLNLE